MTTFGKYLHAVLEQGREEARQDGSAAVEAEHLLLGVAAGPRAVPREVLAEAGLDHRVIREFEHSLNAAGASAAAFDLPRPSANPDRPRRLAASARLAIERGATSAPKKDLQPAHVLLGILRADVGTVPRALALAGIDRAGLAERTRRALA